MDRSTGVVVDVSSDFPRSAAECSGWPWSEEFNGHSEGPISANWPRVTIVTPSFNQGRFLEEAIRSVLLQGYPNLEYIIMDAGSTDDSISIIRKYEKYLTYWTSEPDSGQSDAINRGWRVGTGKILAWVNADDVYEPGVVFEAVRYLNEHRDAGMVCGSVRTVSEADSRKVLRVETAHARPLADALKAGASPGTTAAFIKRKALDQVGYLDSGLHYWIDTELWIRIALAWQLGHVSRPWYRFRIHPSSKTGSSIGSFHAETLACLEKLYLRKDLPESVLKAKPYAMALAYLRLAAAHATSGQYKTARRYYAEAFRNYPSATARLCCKREALRGLGEYLFGGTKVWRDAVQCRRVRKNAAAVHHWIESSS